jgi:hypothetical protein
VPRAPTAIAHRPDRRSSAGWVDSRERAPDHGLQGSRRLAPETVAFYGTLGALDEIAGDHVSFHPAVRRRNVALASMEKRTIGQRDFVWSIDVVFARPIATDLAALVAEIAGAVRAPARTDARGSIARIDVPAGTVWVELGGAGVSRLRIDRAQ